MIRKTAVFGLMVILWLVLPICSANAVTPSIGRVIRPFILGGSATQNNITITQNFSSVYYVDTKTSPYPTGFYAVYNITNNSSSDLSDVWVTLGSFTGSTIYLSLGGNDTGVAHLGKLAAGASKPAYFFLNVDCSSYTSGNCNISTQQGFTVDVYLGPPVDNLLASLTTNDITVFDTIAASANKVTSGSVSTTTPSVGSTFTVTVNGSTGTIGGSNIFALSPETDSSFPADSFELTSTSLTFSNGGSGTYTDYLQIPTSVISGISSADYSVTYTYRVTGTTSSNTTVQPIAYINSGSQVKHTTVSTLGNIPPIQPASNTLLLSMSTSPTSLGLSGGTVTYTVHVTNSGSTAASLDEFIDALASSPDVENYITGSSTFAGSSINDPTINGNTLIWAGTFTVPASSSANLTFQTTIPETVGTYTDFFYGLVSASQIDTTTNTSDDAEATTSVTVSSQQSTTISISNIPASATYGGSFTPTYTYIGDGTKSVASNSTSVCTVTSGVVHYVGVGICSLTASATAGTNYAATTGTAQTFSVGQATPTISISNLPASGTYGGSFAPTFSYTGDGTTSVSSNSTSICTVTSGVVHYVGVGTCSLTASATAGTNYAAVTGSAQTFSVGQATPTISISNLPASGTYGGSFTPTFSYTGDGTTSVSSNSTSICTVTSGVVHYVGVGTCSLTASATAGTNYTSVTGSAQTFSVGKATPTISISNLPASGAYGGSFTPTFSYTGDGTTSVSSNSTSICTVTSGVVHYVGVGTCSLTASATAGTNYNSVTGSAQTFSIGQATPTISISNLPASGTYGGSFTPTFSYTGDGTTSVSSNSTSICTVASGVVHYVGVGTCSLTASATAGTNYNSVTGSAQTFSIGQATPTISISNLPVSGTYGGSFTPTFSYTGDGTTSVSSNSTSICTVTSGVVHYVGVGTCSLTASATAGTNYTSVTGSAQTFSVGQATPTISISNLPASGTYGGSFTPTFSYTGDGTTSVSSNTTSICTVTSGVVHYVGVGTCSLKASATAGTNYTSVTGSAQTFSVGQATPTISISNLPASGTYGGSFTPTFSYTGDGTTSVSSNSTSICTVTSGVVHYVGIGTCSLTASATAGTNYSSVTGTAQTFSVGQATPTISISNLPASGTYGGSFTPTFSYTGDGTTSVSSNSTSICTVTSGVVHYVGVGTCSLTASATAGTNYSSVTGSAQTFSVGQATPTISISNLPASGTYGGSFIPTFSYTGDGTTSVGSNSTSICTVTSGVVHYVGVGTCSLTASATAGTSYAAVTGTAQTFSVGQATPTISISNLPASGTYGGSFTPTFSYTGDGTTSVSSNSTSICTVTSGVVHYVGVGICSLTAGATAGTNYSSVTGTAQTFSVGQATPTINISNLPASGTYGGSFAPTFSYTGDGTTSVSSNSTSICTVTSGVVHYVGVGTCSLTASATAGTNYSSVTGTPQTFSVGQATPTISISNLPASVTYGGSFTPTFSYTGDGTTSVSSNSTSICTVTSGVVHYVGVGTCSLTASATAGTNYSSVTGTAQTFSVGQATPTISISNLPVSGTYGGGFTPAFSYTGDGTTSVNSNSTSICTVSGGVVHYVGVGTCSLTASATAGSNYSAVAGTAQTFTVDHANAVVTLGGLNQTYSGSSEGVTVTTAPSGLAVNVTYNGSTAVPTAAGTYTVVVTINDANYSGSTTQTLVIAPAAQTIAFATLPAQVIYGASQLMLSATGGASGNPIIYSVLSGPASVSGGVLTITGVGTVTVAANQAGNSNYLAALQVTQSIAVIGAMLNVNTAALNFLNQPVGTTSPTQTVILSNSYAFPVTITGIQTTGDFSAAKGCSVIAAQGNCSINVTFTPTAAGSRTGTLSIANAQSNTVQTISLSGVGTVASIQISPAVLSFGSQLVGSTSTGQTITIQNTGTATLSLSSATATGDFATSGNCTAVPAGSNCSLTVTFTPTVAGSRTGTLTLTDNAGNGGQSQQIQLSGSGTQAGATMTPSVQTFPGTLVGSTSQALVATLTNTGSAALTGISTSILGDFTQTNNCPASLAPQASCTLQIVYTPTVAGAETGTVTVTDNLGSQTVSLVGTGLLPGATLSSSQLVFGSQLINTSSQAQTVIFTNTGTGPVNITSVMASTNFTDTTNCTGQIAAGASCSINIIFTPSTAGVLNGTVTITDSAGTQSLTAQGRGVSPGASITPSFVIFGSQVVNTTSPAQTLTATNTGSAPLTLNPITVSNNFTESDQCPAVLPVGGSCLISVSFAPTATGSLYGSLLFSDVSGQVSTVVTLSGQGTIAGISASPSTLSFGSLPVGSASQAQTVTVWNTGSAPLLISSVSGTGDFSETNTCTSSAIPAGGYCVISIAMTPTTMGTRTGTIQIVDNADGVHLISLNGVGQQAGVNVYPTSLSFGSTPYVSTTQASQTTGTALSVSVTNSGNVPLQLGGITTQGDFQETDNCGTTVAVGSVCTLTVRFVPTALGHRTGTLTINDNAGGGVQHVSLEGDGSPSGLILTPPVINFGVQTIGTTSVAKSAKLTNNTGQALTNLAIAPSGEFSETDDCGSALANGASCTLNITVTPATNGAITGAVSITTGTGSGVSGNFVHANVLARPEASTNSSSTSASQVGVVAVSASAIPPGLGLSLPQLSFAVTSIGSPSTGQTITLTNTGTSLSLTNLVISETNVAEFPFTTTCPATLAAQASCAITVHFSPAGYGLRAGTMNITADGGISAVLPESGTASQGTPAVGLTANANTVMAQSSVILTASVSSGAGTPAGNVVFMDGSTALATVALSGGTAAYSTSALTTGAHSITAVYTGSSNYVAATSGALTETVLDFTLSPAGSTGASQSVIPGNTASYTVAIAPTSGASFPAQATLTVAGLPSGATAKLNTTPWTQLSSTSWQVPASTTLNNVSLSINVPGQTAAVRPVEGFGSRMPSVAWGLLLLPFVSRLRRAGKRLAGKVAMLLLLAGGLAGMAGISGCGVHNGFIGQAQKEYTITVTVTTGSLSHSTDLTLTVQ